MDPQNLREHLTHFHVLSKGDGMSAGLLTGVTPEFTKALVDIVKQKGASLDDPFLKYLKGSASIDNKMKKLRKVGKDAQKGGNFGQTALKILGKVGDTALKLAPTLLPLLLA